MMHTLGSFLKLYDDLDVLLWILQVFDATTIDMGMTDNDLWATHSTPSVRYRSIRWTRTPRVQT